MAWVTEYDLGWHSTTQNGTIYLQRDGGSYISPLELAADSLEINNRLRDWEDHVARRNCSFTIVNNLSDFYELMPLMTISEGQIKVIVTNDSFSSDPYILFEGFLNCEAVRQDMLHFSNLTLTASGQLAKLQYNHPLDIDILQYMSLFDIIDSCLAMTGFSYPLYVNCVLYELNAALASGQTLFNRTAVYTELFWENNIERLSALDILESILKSFNCYLTWNAERWYIHHYDKLFDSRTYVIYETGTSAGYGYTDAGTPQNIAISVTNIHDIYSFQHQIGGSQELQVIPGLQRLDIKLNQKDFYNLLNQDLSTSTSTPTAEGLLARRAWTTYDAGSPYNWYGRGEAFQNIDNAIRRWNHDIVTGSLQLNGLTTRFTTSTNGFDTMLIIDFKFGVADINYLAYWLDATEFADNPSDTTITFYWYLCTYEAVIANRDFIWYNEATDLWELVIDGDEQTEYNTLEITAADLDNDLLTYSGTIKIPLGKVDGITDSSGDQNDLDLVFRMGTELVTKAGESDTPAYICYYGDFRASVSGAPENNLLRGDITTDFLDKKEISLDLFDAGWNYRNALVRNTGSVYLTDLWDDGSGSGGESLAEILMKSKFRLYRVARQVINLIMHDIAIPMYVVMGPWYDDKQSDKKFVTLSVTTKPQSNTQQLSLYEYDDAEDITLS